MPENQAREKIIAAPFNVTFLFLEAKLKAKKLSVRKALKLFDAGEKGYLVYKEFEAMVAALDAFIKPSSVQDIIRHMDKKKTLRITQEMIEQGFADCEKMGVTGSPWRLYVEPNTKEIFYHNFDTDEQVD